MRRFVPLSQAETDLCSGYHRRMGAGSVAGRSYQVLYVLSADAQLLDDSI